MEVLVKNKRKLLQMFVGFLQHGGEGVGLRIGVLLEIVQVVAAHIIQEVVKRVFRRQHDEILCNLIFTRLIKGMETQRGDDVVFESGNIHTRLRITV